LGYCNMNSKDTILDDYKKDKTLYYRLASKISELINEILKTNDISVNAIPFREKDIESLSKKISKDGNENKYKKLTDITDLAGVRIITYFSDDVDKIATIIEEEFEVDFQKSIDKRQTHDPDRFGYLSLHYVIKLKPNRAALTEYKPFADLFVEVQVRSILQHAWAEIEHDLGYKSKRAIPKEVRRSFSRLAGLLELTDIEFLRIRDELKEYESTVQEQIKEKPSDVYIDKVSLKSYVENSKLFGEICDEIIKFHNLNLMNEIDIEDVDLEKLHYFGYETISQLDDSISKYKDKIIYMANGILSRGGYISRDIPIFYLFYVLLAEHNDPEKLMEYLDKYIYDDEESDRNIFAKEIKNIYQKSIV